MAEGQLMDWRESLQLTSEDFGYTLLGGESSRMCQVLVLNALTQIVRADEG